LKRQATPDSGTIGTGALADPGCFLELLEKVNDFVASIFGVVHGDFIAFFGEIAAPANHAMIGLDDRVGT
jgi:hypothetical protein